MARRADSEQAGGPCPDIQVVRWRSRRKFKDIEDGLSQTFLAGEKYMHPDKLGRNAYADNSYMNDNHVNNYVRQAGLPNHESIFKYDFFIVPTPEYSAPQLHANPEFVWRNLLIKNFGSSHSGGVCQFAFCDGSVQSIDPDIDQQTLAFLSNVSDGQVVDDFK